MIEIRHRALRQGQSTQSAYNALYQERDILMRDSFYLWLLELIAVQPGELMLDVACGQGRLVEFAAQQGLRAIGTDFSYTGMAETAQRASTANWILADGEGLPLATASVDCILSIGSLEHYEHPLQGVKELARLLKPTGRACILLPNAYGLFGNIQRVFTTGEVLDDGQPLQRYATRRSWEVLLEQGGLQIEKLVPFSEVNLPRTLPDWFWLAQRPQRVVRALLAHWLPANVTNQFVFLCRRATHTPATEPYPMWAHT